MSPVQGVTETNGCLFGHSSREKLDALLIFGNSFSTLKDASRPRHYTRKHCFFRQNIPSRRLIKISGQDNIDLYRRDGWVVESARLLIWWSGQTDPRVQIPLSPLRAGGTSVPLVLYSGILRVFEARVLHSDEQSDQGSSHLIGPFLSVDRPLCFLKAKYLR